ncbi:MAG: TRAP transporter substrate-binding protein DctP [Thermodesulfobacteriota bacterium]
MKKSVAVVVLVLAMFVLGFGTVAAADEIKWKAQTLFAPEDASTAVQAQSVIDCTNEALKSQLVTELYQSGQLIPPEEMAAGLSRGGLDAAIMVSMMIDPAGIVAFGMPYGLSGYDQLVEFWYDHGFNQFMRDLYAKKNIYYVGPLPFGPVSLLSKFPVNKVDDFKGKKIWTEGPLALLVEAVGGRPVWFDPGEVYMGLKLGTIDGVFFGWAELETIKLKEVVQYVMTPSILDPVNFDWVVSLEAWNKLSPEMQATYLKAFKENLPKQSQRSLEVCQAGLEAAKASGVQVTTLPPEELAKMQDQIKKVWDSVAAEDDNSAQAIKMLRAYLQTKGITR